MKVVAKILLVVALVNGCKSMHSSDGSNAKSVVVGDEEGPSYFLHKSKSAERVCVRTCPMGVAGAQAQKGSLYGLCHLKGAIVIDAVADVTFTYPEYASDLGKKIHSESIFFEITSTEYAKTIEEMLQEPPFEKDVPGNDCLILADQDPSGGGSTATMQKSRRFKLQNKSANYLKVLYWITKDGSVGQKKWENLSRAETYDTQEAGSEITIEAYRVDNVHHTETPAGTATYSVNPYQSEKVEESIIPLP